MVVVGGEGRVGESGLFRVFFFFGRCCRRVTVVLNGT